jgi:hypothetical protein
MKALGLFWTTTLLASLAATADPGEGPERKALFGELHMHTRYSTDSYYLGTRATPDDAYEFAKGKPLKHSNGQTYRMLPLDFMAVTDHAEFMGISTRIGDPSHSLSKLPIADRITSDDSSIGWAAVDEMRRALNSGKPMEGTATLEIKSEVWDSVVASANRHNDPGTFTALVAYEWSGGFAGRPVHRNVIFKGDTAPIPFSALDSSKPEGLWAWMEKIRAEGHTVLAIPHNSNGSDGIGFDQVDSFDNPLTAEYAAIRNRNEPLVEVTQIKGTSETHPSLSPNDEFADFEIFELYIGVNKPLTRFKGSYVRDAYRTGLEFQNKQGFNPYRFGLVGATDSHSGFTSVEENNYSGMSGKFGTIKEAAEARLIGSVAFRKPRTRFFGATGLTGVWAKENTREGIYETLERKETWGTTGPRIKVRFFGGLHMGGVDPNKPNWIEKAYQKGVSMGGAWHGRYGNGGAPTFAVWAIKDAESANLDRIQIVKGWFFDGESHERVYDVVWSGGRVPNPKTGKVPAVGNTVNLETLEYTNSIGAVELKGLWTDPDFNSNQTSFYYLRVLEIPTPRWSMFDAKTLGVPHPTDVPKTIQERAYTSPIWFDPRPPNQ